MTASSGSSMLVVCYHVDMAMDRSCIHKMGEEFVIKTICKVV